MAGASQKQNAVFENHGRRVIKTKRNLLKAWPARCSWAVVANMILFRRRAEGGPRAGLGRGLEGRGVGVRIALGQPMGESLWGGGLGVGAEEWPWVGLRGGLERGLRRGRRGKQKKIVRVLHKCYQGVFKIRYKERSLHGHAPSKLLQQVASTRARIFCDATENDDEAKPWVPTTATHNDDDDNT